MYRYLFSPIQINRLEIKNRVAYPSLGLLYSKNGKLNDRYFNYFKERANGGAGLVTVGPVGVDFIGSGAIALSLAHDDAITDFKKLAGIIKDGGLEPGFSCSMPVRIHTRCLLMAGSRSLLQRFIRAIHRRRRGK